jgi:hypothetical protein
VSEIRYALRSLIKTPGPTLVMVLTLGVAVGAATVIYSVIDLVWHFIPAPNQTRLVYAASTDTRVVPAEGGTQRCRMIGFRAGPRRLGGTGPTFEQLTGFRIGSVSCGVDVPRAHHVNRRHQPCPTCGASRQPSVERSVPRRSARRRNPALAGFWQQQFSATRSSDRRCSLTTSAHDRQRPSAGGGLGSSGRRRLHAVRARHAARSAGPRDVLVTGRLKPGVTREQATESKRPPTGANIDTNQQLAPPCRSSKHRPQHAFS